MANGGPRTLGRPMEVFEPDTKRERFLLRPLAHNFPVPLPNIVRLLSATRNQETQARWLSAKHIALT